MIPKRHYYNTHSKKKNRKNNVLILLSLLFNQVLERISLQFFSLEIILLLQIFFKFWFFSILQMNSSSICTKDCRSERFKSKRQRVSITAVIRCLFYSFIQQTNCTGTNDAFHWLSDCRAISTLIYWLQLQ